MRQARPKVIAALMLIAVLAIAVTGSIWVVRIAREPTDAVRTEFNYLAGAKAEFLRLARLRGAVPQVEELGVYSEDIFGRLHEITLSEDGQVATIRSRSPRLPIKAVFRVRDAGGEWASSSAEWVSPPEIYPMADRRLVWVHNDGTSTVESVVVRCGEELRYRPLLPGEARVEASVVRPGNLLRVEWVSGGVAHGKDIAVGAGVRFPIHIRISADAAALDPALGGKDAEK